MDIELLEKIDPSKIKLRIGPTFKATLATKKQQHPELGEKVIDFWKAKKQNPLQRIGGERPTSGPFAKAIKGIQHYHLTPDLSLWWRISGSDPVFIDFLGIYSHDETGTGQPGKPKIQQQSAERMRNEINNLEVVKEPSEKDKNKNG